MADRLLLESGDLLLLENGSDALLLESGSGGGGGSGALSMRPRMVAPPRSRPLGEGRTRRSAIPPTGAQIVLFATRTIRDDHERDPFRGRVTRAPLPPSGDNVLRMQSTTIRDVAVPPPFSGRVDRSPIPPTGEQIVLYLSRRVRDVAVPPPFPGITRRAPIPPTGAVPSLAVPPPPRMLRAMFFPRDGHVQRTPIPPTGLESGPLFPSRHVRPAPPTPFAGRTSRIPLLFHTGEEAPPPTPVDSLRPFIFSRQGQSALFRGRIVRQPLPPTGEQIVLFVPRIVHDDAERDPFPGRCRRSPIPPTGEGPPLPRPSRIVRPPQSAEFLLPGTLRIILPPPASPIAAGLLAIRNCVPPAAPVFTGRIRRGPRTGLFSTGSVPNVGRTAVGPPFLGGFALTGAEWLGTHALRITWSTTYGSDYHYQLYAGRTLIGVTTSTTQRQLVAQLQPSDWSQVLQLVAVTTANRLTDYGSLLPLRPYNRVRLVFTAAGMPSDTKWIEITSGTAAGEAVDTDNVLALLPFAGNRVYSWRSDPLAGSGTWNFAVAARDERPPGGNRGTALALSAAVLSSPPDVVPNSSGQRLTVTVADQEATITFTEPD